MKKAKFKLAIKVKQKPKSVEATQPPASKARLGKLKKAEVAKAKDKVKFWDEVLHGGTYKVKRMGGFHLCISYVNQAGGPVWYGSVRGAYANHTVSDYFPTEEEATIYAYRKAKLYYEETKEAFEKAKPLYEALNEMEDEAFN